MIPRILIVDDEAPARSRMTTLLSDVMVDCPHLLVGAAAQPEQALALVQQLRADIVLLDIQMPGMDGLALAAEISKSIDPAPAIIFVTAHEQHALQAFELYAVDYLLKPVRATRLTQALQRAIAWCQTRVVIGTARTHFSVLERGRILRVPVTDVLYLKAEQKYITLRSATRDYLIEASLVSLETELEQVFIRVHRNALVARAAISGVMRSKHTAEPEPNESGGSTWEVALRGIDERLPISRRHWPAIRALVRQSEV
ncbi:MAG: LytTR family DNA-binding domain-containing protein [Herbaspirillum sp.]